MLLATNGYSPDIDQSPGSGYCLIESKPPMTGVHFCALGMAGSPLANQHARYGVDDDDLAALSRRIDTGYQRHLLASPHEMFYCELV
jgi:hypothetical protein